MKQTGNTHSDPQGFGITTRWRWMAVKMIDVDVPLHGVMVMTISSLPIPPPHAIQRLGFFVLDEFLGSLGIGSTIRSRGVEVVDQTAVTACGTSGSAHTVRGPSSWTPPSDFFLLPNDLFFYGSTLSRL
jgi:hypothetical protein